MDKFVSQIWLISQAQQMAPLVPKMQATTIQAFGCKNKQSWLISKTWHLEYFSYQGMANKQYAHISRIISKTWHLEIFCSFSREARSYWPQGNWGHRGHPEGQRNTTKGHIGQFYPLVFFFFFFIYNLPSLFFGHRFPLGKRKCILADKAGQ